MKILVASSAPPDVVAWHRVHPPAGRRNPLSVRHAYRMGRLNVVGQLGPGH
jgi:hypothetical protein